MFSGLGFSLIINLRFPCCEADGNSLERNAKHSLGRTGGRARGEREELEVLNTAQNDKLSEKNTNPLAAGATLTCTPDNPSTVFLLWPEFMNAGKQILLIGNLSI